MSETTTERVKKIKPLLNFSKFTDNDFAKRLHAIRDGITGNSAFPTPPVDMTVFKSSVELYDTLITDALDGGKKAISAKRKQREIVTKLAIQLGHYVWAAANNDLAVFNTSGFEVAQNTKTPPQPLSKASFQYLDRSPMSGQIVIKPKSQDGAISYDVHYNALPAGAVSALTLPSPKAATISNLTPGTTYQFQIRALGKLGYSDWSDPTTFICT
jgi:hypothetical protein